MTSTAYTSVPTGTALSADDLQWLIDGGFRFQGSDGPVDPDAGPGPTGYFVGEYLRDGRWLGPDQHGVQPVFLRTLEQARLRTRSIETPDGPYVVYHREAHQSTGPWHFQPEDYDGGDVYSRGYPSPEAASDAALAWAQLLRLGFEALDALNGTQQLAPSPSPERQR